MLTVRTGSSFILALFCGVLPIYMCFTYWGYDWFGNEVENFSTVWQGWGRALPQHLDTSAPRHLNTSTPQHLNTSTPQHLNTSTPQHLTTHLTSPTGHRHVKYSIRGAQRRLDPRHIPSVRLFLPGARPGQSSLVEYLVGCHVGCFQLFYRYDWWRLVLFRFGHLLLYTTTTAAVATVVAAAASRQIYLYLFISMFIYVVLNIVIATVEESFFNSRSYKRSLQLSEVSTTTTATATATATAATTTTTTTTAPLQPLIRETVGLQIARERAQRMREAEERLAQAEAEGGADGGQGRAEEKSGDASASANATDRPRTASTASEAVDEALAEALAEAVEEAEELREELEVEEEEAAALAEEARGANGIGAGGDFGGVGGIGAGVGGADYVRPTKVVVPLSGAKFWGPHFVRFEQLLDDLSDIDLARRMD